ncbi:GNAT family N-acetyltransferase [Candidatus Bathyarchaeota archaeon]|nr:MAG: GNAT family N-acetyltransferase [Candidatus Bathyarchaeota archaeon]
MCTAMMEGPRGLRENEISSVRRLTDICFWHGLVDKYPQLFNEDNLENLRVIVKDGEVISHVGMTYQWASIFGCRLKVACIGAVCTHPKYRMRGLATKLFNDACLKAYRDGIDFMMVCRGLYLRAGCRRIVGCYYKAVINGSIASRLKCDYVTVRNADVEDLPLISALYRREPVRFQRKLEDYQRAFKTRLVMDRNSDFLIIERGGSPKAYVILSKSKDRQRTVTEYAGERISIIEGLAEIVRLHSLEEIVIYIPKHDFILRDIIRSRRVSFVPNGSTGTVKIINFIQLMERMLPYFEELVGSRTVERLSFHEEEGKCIISFNGEKISLGTYPEATQVLFGSEDAPTKWREHKGEGVEIIRKILPIPLPWYGINYV